MTTRLLRWLAALTAVVSAGLAVPGGAGALPAVHAAGLAAPITATKSHVAKRFYVEHGTKRKVVDHRKVYVTVSQTNDLRSLQQIHVSWSGAHPTDGIYSDVNSDYAQNEEYSFDLLECRGLDSKHVPARQRLSPRTCWTQYADERFRASYDAYPAWRSDALASKAQRKSSVGALSAHRQPTSCKNQLIGVEAQRWVPFKAAGHKSYPGGPDGCAGQAPEASPENLSSLALPSNETFGVTDKAGNGQADFDIFTAEDHASLGCSQQVPCSLVAVPIEGISCDPAGHLLPKAARPDAADVADAQANCETKGNFKPGQLLNNVEQSGAAAVDGSLWWSPSNWANRISFPLSFAAADNVCDVVSNQAPLDVYGSELLAQAATQWAPHFCLQAKLFNLKHVQTPEPEARNLLASGNIDASIGSQAVGPGSTPRVNAPVAISGFGIAFDIDNRSGKPVSRLRLDARLLAKLLTESYPDQTFVKEAYPTTDGVATLGNNPLNMAFDPEFQALNPNIPTPEIDAAATLLTVNTNSDVMTALTSYINADPEARAWLNGKPDPWGMRVNPNYKGIKLPVSQWPLLDSFEPTAEYQPGKNDCLAADPVPYLPLVAAPTASLFNIAQDMEFAISQSQTTCFLPSPIPGDTAGAKLVAAGRQSPGHRFMLGVVSLGDARRYNLSVAALETQRSASAPSKFTSPTGRTFVQPTAKALRTAAQSLHGDPQTGSWPVNYQRLRTSAADKHAYPGMLPIYASVPTKGLPSADAKHYADFLRYAAGAGQRPGLGQGQLPPGYVPMTAANGLGRLAAYTRRAASAVAAQLGGRPMPHGPAGSGGGGVPRPAGDAVAAGGGLRPAGPTPDLPAAVATHAAGDSAAPQVAPAAEQAKASTTGSFGAGAGGMALPISFLVLIGGGIGVAAVRARGGRPR